MSFVIHATRGVIRDHNVRRKAMFALVVIALVLLLAGSTILQSFLNLHEHPIWFILFWLVCAWLAVTAMLLALFDLLMVKSEARKAERILREKFAQLQTPDSPRSTRLGHPPSQGYGATGGSGAAEQSTKSTSTD